MFVVCRSVPDCDDFDLVYAGSKAHLDSQEQGESAAETVLRQDVSDIHRVFDTIDRQLDVIGETRGRIEKCIATIVRYMDRDTGGAVQRLSDALEKADLRRANSRRA